MIRAWQDASVDVAQHRREYEELRDEWRVEPFLEVALRRRATS